MMKLKTKSVIATTLLLAAFTANATESKCVNSYVNPGVITAEASQRGFIELPINRSGAASIVLIGGDKIIDTQVSRSISHVVTISEDKTALIFSHDSSSSNQNGQLHINTEQGRMHTINIIASRDNEANNYKVVIEG
ncbi:hypothetical protein [Thaumasiovibrio subtropicus]|uniref:hypothetical protein n=1 Tax=Thaumasiovibrio subtropicus TaxID=1891207 RepID=UPI00131A7E5F|nr:hypothetical protein [Thaumasiovibrio subtropicus]